MVIIMFASIGQPRKISYKGLNIALGVCVCISSILIKLSIITGISCFGGVKIPGLPEFSPLHFFAAIAGFALSTGIIVLSSLGQSITKLAEAKINAPGSIVNTSESQTPPQDQQESSTTSPRR
ncbi:hypothetical protein FDZ63_02790 [Ehrlichia ruminantium]|nr:hypothetical protein FDZ65_02795 [Ehrlichia ruminantium]QLK54665.1 hypothetical protein FDZ63_02790 [Ehrlichia ruminantium]QLK57414.1 hypothetical protein FDZ60_02800 [Ehrlichia ruminantium]